MTALPLIPNPIDDGSAAFERFRRALRRSDQQALDDLLMLARRHEAAAKLDERHLLVEILLVSMVIEQHKLIVELRAKLERYWMDDTPKGVTEMTEMEDLRETLSDLENEQLLGQPTPNVRLDEPRHAPGRVIVKPDEPRYEVLEDDQADDWMFFDQSLGKPCGPKEIKKK